MENLKEVIDSLEKGDSIGLYLDYSSQLRSFRAGKYLGRTKRRIWVMSSFAGTPWLSIELPIGYSIKKIKKIELFTK